MGAAFDDLWSRLWTPTNRELFRAWLGTAIRAAIIAAGAWLKAIGKFPFITGPTVDKIAGYAPQLAGDAIIFGGLAWSAVQKWIADRREKTALAMPAKSTQAVLNTVMKVTSPGLIPIGPIPSPATAAAVVEIIKTGPSPEVMAAVRADIKAGSLAPETITTASADGSYKTEPKP